MNQVEKMKQRFQNASPETRNAMAKAVLESIGFSEDTVIDLENPENMDPDVQKAIQEMFHQNGNGKQAKAVSTATPTASPTGGTPNPDDTANPYEPPAAQDDGPVAAWKKAAGVRHGEDPTTSRPYSFAKLARAAVDHTGMEDTKLELEVHRVMKQDLGYTPKEGFMAPLDATFLENMHPRKMKGIADLVTEGYVPSSSMAKRLKLCKDLGITSEDRKSLLAGSDPEGGHLVPTEERAELIDMLRSRLVLQRTDVQEVTIEGKGVTWPTKIQGTTAYRRREANSVSESQMRYGSKSIEPKLLSALVSTSNELMNRAEINVERQVREDMAQSIAEREEHDFFYGNGGSDEPLGIRNHPNIVVVTPDNGVGGLLSSADVFELETVIDENGAEFTAYVTAPRAVQRLRQLREGALDSNDNVVESVGGFLFDRNIGPPGSAGSLNGHNLFSGHVINNDLNGSGQTEVFGGDWSEVLIGRGAALEIAADTSLGFKEGLVFFKANVEDDLLMQHEQGMAVTDRVAV